MADMIERAARHNKDLISGLSNAVIRQCIDFCYAASRNVVSLLLGGHLAGGTSANLARTLFRLRL